MKTKFLNILILIAIVLATAMTSTSCQDQDDIQISYETGLTITAEHLFDGFHPVHDEDFSLSIDPGIELQLNSFIYDSSGVLVDSLQLRTSNLSNPMKYSPKLVPGKYTLVSVALFGKQVQNEFSAYWQILNPDKLINFEIKEANNTYMRAGQFETLGLDVQELNITDSPLQKLIDIRPITALVNIYMICQDYQNPSSVSNTAKYCQKVNIWSNMLKQSVKISGDKFEYFDGPEAQNYLIYTEIPKNLYKNNVRYSYCYRAILPVSQLCYWWDIKFDAGKGSQFGLPDFAESDLTSKVDIKSGSQYNLDLLFDAYYLFHEEHDSSESFADRVNRHIMWHNLKEFHKVYDYDFDLFIGKTFEQIQSEIKETDWLGNIRRGVTSGDIMTYDGYNIYVKSVIFTRNPHTKLTEKIVMSFKNLASTGLVKDMVTYLNYRFTSWTSDSDSKVFINANTLTDATLKVTWNTNSHILTMEQIN